MHDMGYKSIGSFDPRACSIEVFVLENHGYHSLGMFQEKESIPSQVVPDIRLIRVEQFFS
jgi:hypothetical protein